MDAHKLFKLIDQLQEEARCPVCLGTVDDPKTLPCLHSFCLSCLKQIPCDDEDEVIIDCPVCRTYVEIPEDLNDLPTSFHLNRLLDILPLRGVDTEAQRCSRCDKSNTATCYCFVCLKFMCQACFESHQRSNGSTGGQRNVLIDNLQAGQVFGTDHTPSLCSQKYHDLIEPLKYYCQQCQACICEKCCEENHDQHVMMDIGEAADVEKMNMRSVTNKLKPLAVFYQTRMNKQTELMERSKEENVAAHKKVTETVEELIRSLREHEMTIHTKLDEIYDIQERDHSTQLKNFQLLVTQLNGFVEYGDAILERNLSDEILQSRSYGKRGEEFLNLKKIELYDPQHVDYVVKMQSLIQGHVIVKHADASKSVAKGSGLERADMDNKTSFTVIIIDEEGNQFYHQDDQMAVNVVDPQGEFLNMNIKDYKDGKYKVSYTPKSVGIHTVAIDVNGKALAGTPQKVEVTPHQYEWVFDFGSSGRQQGQFDWPVSIAISKRTGNIAVADSDNKRIQLFDSDGDFLREFGQNGIEKLDKPNSVAFTSSGDVTVLDSSKIFVFDESGNFIKRTVSKHLINPSSLSVGHADHLIVCDKGDKKIKVLSPDGTDLLRSFSAPDCDTSPQFAVYHQNKIFVSYFEANCVKVFSMKGNFAFNIGNKLGSKDRDGLLIGPLGLAIDKHGYLIVCDFHNKRLQLFTSDGRFMSKIELPHNVAPHAVAVANDNCLLMIDILGHAINVFQ